MTRQLRMFYAAALGVNAMVAIGNIGIWVWLIYDAYNRPHVSGLRLWQGGLPSFIRPDSL